MWKHGIGEVSVDMILERADVMKGSFYHFFAAKTDLLLECLDNVLAPAGRTPGGDLRGGADPEAALEQHLQMLAQAQIEGNERLGFVPGSFNMSMPTSLLREDPRITGKLHELMQSNLDYLETDFGRSPPASPVNSVKVTARLLSYRWRRSAGRADEQQSEASADFKLMLATALGILEPRTESSYLPWLDYGHQLRPRCGTAALPTPEVRGARVFGAFEPSLQARALVAG